jgi:hypothetical protein
MKNLILFAVLMLLLASCKKSSSGNITASNTVSATIKGDGMSFMNISDAYADIDNNNPLDYYFYADAYDSLNNELQVSFDSYYKNLSPRTYGIIGDSTTDAYVEFRQQGGNDYYSYTGINSVSTPIIVVTSVGPALQGTFKGELYLNGNTSSSDSIYISDGKFNIYQ